MTLEDRVVNLLALTSGFSEEEIRTETIIATELGLDSLDILSLFHDIRTEFGLDLEPDTFDKATTVADLIKHIEDRPQSTDPFRSTRFEGDDKVTHNGKADGNGTHLGRQNA